MPVTRRGLFSGALGLRPGGDWIAARGREAWMAGEAQQAATTSPLIRISSNENPLGPGAHVVAAITGTFPEAARYPGNAQRREDTLVSAIAARYAAKPAHVVLGAGSGEILTNAVRAFTSPTRPLVTAWPSFEAPRDTARKIGTPVREVGFDAGLTIDLAKMAEAARGAGLVFFCNPNNPTATVHGKTAVADLVKAVRQASPDTVILIDEAYHDYVTLPAYETAVPLALSTPNVFVARTFSKAHGMAGLRAGYAIGDPAAIAKLQAYKMPNGLGTLTLTAALTSLARSNCVTRSIAPFCFTSSCSLRQPASTIAPASSAILRALASQARCPEVSVAAPLMPSLPCRGTRPSRGPRACRSRARRAGAGGGCRSRRST